MTAMPRASGALALVVGAAAVVAPLMHSLSDVLEAVQGGFSPAQLRLNYVAFLAMPWLLLGVIAVRAPDAGYVPVIGAVLYGCAFVYFAHTTLVALADGVPTYDVLWRRLGDTYTLHGAMMVVGGLLFALPLLRHATLSKAAVALFAAGIALNLALWIVPAPEILQTIGSALRNLGIVAMGVDILAARSRVAGAPEA